MTATTSVPAYLLAVHSCAVKWQLWNAWHTTVTPFRGEWHELKPGEHERMEAEHESEEYQQALAAYREHLTSCEVCKTNSAAIAGTI